MPVEPPAVLNFPGPKLREGVDIWPLFPSSPSRDGVFLIGHTELDRYVVVSEAKLPVVRDILGMLDGRHTLEEIDSTFLTKHQKAVRSAQLCGQLADAGLIEGTVCPEGDVAKASVKLGGIPVAPMLRKASAIPPKLLSVAAIAGIAIILLGLWLTIGAWGELVKPLISAWRGPSRFFNLEVFGKYALVCAGSVFLHEMAHALAGARFGLIANRLEVSLYLGIVPIVFLRIPGLYTISPKRRVIVWSAGIFVNLILAALGMTHLIWFGKHDGAMSVAYVLALVNYSFAVSNLIPFLPTDGYFILSTVFRLYNLRRNAMRQLSQSVEARSLRFTPLGVVYLTVTALLLGLTLWRDVILLMRIHFGRFGSAEIGALVLILPWLLLVVQVCRNRARLFRKSHAAGDGDQQLPTV